MTRCAHASATRSPRSTWRSARPRRSAATSISSIGKAWQWDGKAEVEIPIPAELAAEVDRRRDQLLRAAAEADDDVLAKYLDGAEVSDPELEACLRKGVKESILAPVLVGSALRGIGLRALLDAFIRYLPSPADEPATQAREPKSGDAIAVPADPAGPLLVRAFKTAADPFVGRLTYLRVSSARSTARATSGTRSAARRSGSASSCWSTARTRSRSAS